MVWDPLPAVSACKDALAAGSSIVHSGDANNVAFEATAVGGDEAVSSNIKVSAEFSFGRHTGVTLETRAAIADWNSGDETLTDFCVSSDALAAARRLQPPPRYRGA